MAMELDKTAMKPKQDRIRQDPEALSDDMKLTELKVGMTVGVWSATQGLWYKATIGEISDTAILCNLAAGGAKKVRPQDKDKFIKKAEDSDTAQSEATADGVHMTPA